MANDHPHSPFSRPNLDQGPPQVAIRPQPWAIPLMVVAALALGGVVFWQLSQGRERAAQERLTTPSRDAPRSGSQDLPPPAAPADPPPVFQPEPVFQTPPAAYVPDEALPPQGLELAPTDASARLRAPALVIDLSEAAPANVGGTPSAAPVIGASLARAAVDAAGGPRASADDRFSADIRGDSARSRVERLAHPEATVVEGTVMAAVLETAVNSDLPGLARAIITRDVPSFDGSRVLIPRGSRVIGQYKSGVALGQSRAFVIWNRLIRPDGASVDIASPGTDQLGRGGLEGKVDRHFLQRFGGSILLSLISAGAASAADGDTRVIIAGARSGADAAAIALQKEIDLPPTIRVQQGAPIRIIVARDLDFSGLGQQP
ncbi:MAG: TrbI/VirB10 family protein [Caulobacterales bacterium]